MVSDLPFSPFLPFGSVQGKAECSFSAVLHEVRFSVPPLACQTGKAGIQFKKYTKPQLGYLSVDEISAILAKPDLNTLKGRRDLTIISLLYDSGACVSEIANLKVRDVRIDEYPIVTLNGKGNKIR